MKANRYSWFTLITFCATAGVVTALGFALFVASVTLAFAAGQSAQQSQISAERKVLAQTSVTKTYSGLITDSRCGARHKTNLGESPAECARMCVSKGSKYILVDGDKQFVLNGNVSDLAKLAGQRTTVTGTLDGNTINVSSVTAQNLK